MTYSQLFDLYDLCQKHFVDKAEIQWKEIEAKLPDDMSEGEKMLQKHYYIQSCLMPPLSPIRSHGWLGLFGL